MGLALVVMIDNLKAEIRVALDEGCSYVGNVATPFAAMDTEHRVIYLIVLQPFKLIEPIDTKSSRFTCDGSRRRWIIAAAKRHRRTFWIAKKLMLLKNFR
jgi:hypothetical protein